MQILGLLIVGIIIGLLARAILPGRQKIGLVWTLVLGVAGALIGGTIASALAAGDVFELNFVGFIAAVASAVALLAIGERMGLGAGPERRHVGPGRA
jgi:uncharacterized membrane protein YeaQ/YmgE (transglycosylase-associated protein family)